MFVNGILTTPLTPGDISLLNCLYDARDGLRQVMKRWEDRMVFENISLAEKYTEGRLSIACYVEICGSGNRIEPHAFADTQTRINKLIVVVIICAHTSQLSYRNDWDQKSMFVNNTQLVKGPEGVIPSSVWLNEIGDQVTNILPGHLYFSTIDQRYKFISRITDREIGISGRDISGFGNNLTSHNVQGGTQIMDDVTNNQGNFAWQRVGIERQDIMPSEVFVDMQTVKVSFKECIKTSLKLLDVVVGPFDL